MAGDDYQAYLYGTLVQVFLYGIYLLTLGHCLRWLLFDDEGWKVRRRIDWPMLLTSVLLFLFSTIDVGLSIKALIGYNDLEFFLQYYRIICLFDNATLLVTDGILIYRCWVVYRKLWRIIFLPILLWLGCFAGMVVIFYYETLVLRPSLFKYGSRQGLHVLDAFYACNIVINLYATSLIVYRILRVANESKAGGRVEYLYRATRIIAESGILYTLTSILNLIALLLGLITKLDTLQAVSESINYAMAGIAFNLILIRVGRNRNDKERSIRTDTQGITNETKISTIQFYASNSESQNRSMTSLEDGIQFKQ